MPDAGIDRPVSEFLARVAWELTISARSTYIAGTDDVADPATLRTLNEVQHRILQALQQSLRGEPVVVAEVLAGAISRAHAAGRADLVESAITHARASVRSQP